MHKDYKDPKQQSGHHVPRGVLIQSGTFVLSHHQMRPHNVITRGGQNLSEYMRRDGAISQCMMVHTLGFC